MESLTNILEVQDMDSVETTIEEYIKNTKLQAEDLVQNVFPRKVLELEKILKNAASNIRSTMHDELKTIVPDPSMQVDDAGETVPKKRVLNVGTDSAADNNHTGFTIPCNEYVINVIELMKPRIHQSLEEIQALKRWTQFLTPRKDEANVSIRPALDEILKEMKTNERKIKGFSGEISDYFRSRGKMLSKVMKYPHLDDYKKAVKELDENFHLRVCYNLRELADFYATGHKMISENVEKIKKPQEFNPETVY